MTRTDLAAITDAIDRQSMAIEAQTKVFAELTAFLIHGPEYKEIEFQSIEEDGLEEEVSVGEYDTETQARDDIIKRWREDGYPDDVLKYFE